jgi:MFS family permease
MNNQNKEINETIKRTKRYWYVDGFSEIGIGLLLIVIILFNYAAGLAQNAILQVLLFVVGLPALIVLGSRALSHVVVKLKEKYTYPRTGYVAYQGKTGSRRWKRVLLAGTMGLLVGALTSLLSGNLPIIYQQLFVALMIALAYIYIGYSIGLKRFYWIAGATLALGGALILAGVSEAQHLLIFFVGQGLIWIVSGLAAMRQYFGSTQPPAEAGER